MTTAVLAQRSAAGFGWNVAGGAARAGLGLAVNGVMARLLGPEPFGQVAVVMAGISLGNLLVECGLGTGLIQKAEVEESDARAAFTLQMTAGLGLALLDHRPGQVLPVQDHVHTQQHSAPGEREAIDHLHVRLSGIAEALLHGQFQQQAPQIPGGNQPLQHRGPTIPTRQPRTRIQFNHLAPALLLFMFRCPVCG